MRATQLAIEVSGNNVTNARTPGFVKQKLDLQAKRFEIGRGLVGGVEEGKLISGRQEFLETAVQEQAHRYGRFAQQTSDLERLEPIFDVTSNAGLGGSIDRLFQSFSALSIDPNDTPLREAVLERSRNLAQNFRSTSASLASAKLDGQNQLRSTTEAINQIGQQIQKYNLEVRTDIRKLEDPGLEAQAFNQLEQLSELVDFDLIRAPDGSFNVNVGGQTPLTIGNSFFPIWVDVSDTSAAIRNSQGVDITSQIQQGRLRAELDQQNGFLPNLVTDLNRLAETVATSVNTVLAGGLDRDGIVPVKDLFSFDASSAATSILVTDIDASELAAASTGAPGGNGNALALDDLSRTPLIDNYSPSQFYGSLAGRVGRNLANSRIDEQAQSLMLSQSRSLRASETEVSIDEEAANIVAFQRQYEANAELIRILNSMTETTINIIR
jgi:flagellar hook-associated protein 1 FlgK